MNTQKKPGSAVAPEIMAAYVYKGAVKIARLSVQTSEVHSAWTTDMLDEFGEKVSPHLNEIWEAALRRYEAGEPDDHVFKKITDPADPRYGLANKKLQYAEYDAAHARLLERLRQRRTEE